MAPPVLQEFDPGIEAGQRDMIVEVARLRDQLVDQPPRLGKLIVACLRRRLHPLAQGRDLGPGGGLALVERQQHTPDQGRLLDRVDVGVSKLDVAGKVVLIEHRQLLVDGLGQPRAEPCHRAHQQ